MEKLRESNIVTMRFWKNLFQIAPKTDSAVDLSYRHAFLVMFLHAEPVQSELNEAIVRRIWLRDNPGGSNTARDEQLRTRSVYAWLMSADPHAYYEHVERVYHATVESLDRQGRDRFGFPSNREWLAAQATFMQYWLSEASQAQILHAFDHGYAQRLRSTVDIARETFAANLAASCLTEGVTSIGDISKGSGQFSRIVAEQNNQNISCLLGRREAYDDIVEMRMHMQRIRFEYVKQEVPEAGYLHWPKLVNFLLLNPTPRGGGGRASRPSGDSALHEPSSSALELIGNLCRRRTLFHFALVVVPHSDCTSLHWPREIRRELIESGRIAAVIDFPRKALDVRSKKFSAWLVKGDAVMGEHQKSDEILFIDAEPLSLLTHANENQSTAQFIGALISKVFGGVPSQSAVLQRLGSTDPLLARIFSREFASGFNDVNGLARSVSSNEVRNREFVLTTIPYLRSSDTASWLQGLDRRLLIDLMADNSRLGKRIYIIGNNGEGKSFLLKDIATSSAMDGRPTVAIAFGSSDRFPKRMQRRTGDTYRYRGARNSAAGVNSLQTAVEAGKLMLEIYSEPERLKVFEELAHLVGFTSEQFLIPRGLKDNTQSDEGLVSGIVRLASQKQDDQELINNLRQHPEHIGKYKLGLRRFTDHDGIVPFDELSSGEQQIVLLAAKMVAESKRNVLFIVDEPEISLHVGWQRALPKIFETISRNFEADVLVATHSPVVISSADGSQDYCFTIRDKALVALSTHDRRSVETALFEGFRTHTNNNREVHERCASLVADFIDVANQDIVDGKSELRFLAKLEDMKKIVDGQNRMYEVDSTAFEIDLIERAKAAIHEIAAFRSAQPTGQDNE